jgi:hypothetical protein
MRRARYFLVIALLVGACGNDSESDSGSGQLERDLAKKIEQTTGTKDVTVACPEDATGGDLCDATAPGGLKAKVTLDGKVVQP